MEPATTNPHRWPARALVVCFFLGLGVPLLDFFFRVDPTSAPNEKRLLAELPPRPENFGAVKKFLAGWEAYFSDHFGCRKVLVMWQNKLKWSLFRDKRVRDVLNGRDGWMFYSAAQMIEQYRGLRPLSERELLAWQKLLEHRRDWLAARGIKYLFVLAPDKQSIYPEQLPAWLQPLAGQTQADQFFAHMSAHSTVAVLDLRPVLRDAKRLGPLYLQTDTHWNHLGAFIAGQEVIRQLARHQLPGLKPVALEDFTCTNRLVAGGDLARGLGISLTESNALFLEARTNLPPVEVYFPKGEQTRDPAYAKNPLGLGRAVCYHDSFGRPWVPFFAYSFREADFFWHYRYELEPAVIERIHPDIVISEMLERFFNQTNPNELSALDALPSSP
jgi:hypothetical protein